MRFLVFPLLALFAVPAFAQTAPPVPTNVSAAATSSTTAEVTWSPSSGADGYRVFRNDASPGTLTNSTTFIDSGLEPGTTYSYTVAAFTIETGTSTEISSARSAAVMVTTPDAPGAPGNLRGSPTANGIVLNWNLVADAEEYVVFRDGNELDTTASTTYTDTDVELSTTYRYSVAAVVDGEESAPSTEITVVSRGDGSGREAYWLRDFRRADVNYDEVISFEEYLLSNTNPRKNWTGLRHRFILSDFDDSDGLTIDEFARTFGGRKFRKPTKPQQFYLADRAFLDDEFDEPDGLLDPAEFVLTLRQGMSWEKAMKRFDRLDKNDTGLLSQREFGIRRGSSEDDL